MPLTESQLKDQGMGFTRPIRVIDVGPGSQGFFDLLSQTERARLSASSLQPDALNPFSPTASALQSIAGDKGSQADE